MRFRNILTFFVAIVLVFSVFGLTPASANADTISVKLSNYIGNKTNLSFTLSGDFSIKEDAKINLEKNKKYTIKISGSKLQLFGPDGKMVKEFGNSFTVESKKYSTSNIHTIYGNQEKKYLGNIRYEIEGGNYIRPVNVNIPFEDYLKGVVPLEMPALWSLEAVKSQAVAARTYSESKRGTTVADTQSFQVYGGYDWHPNSTKAVEDTKGKILTYNGRSIGTNAVYSSSNGGNTESSANLWGSSSIAYLSAKKDALDPVNKWEVSVNNEEINTRVLDLAKPNNWWNSVNEKNAVVTNNIKKWLNSKSEYNNTDIKIVSIPQLTFSNKNSSGRSKDATITVEFFVKDKSNNSYRMQNGNIRKYSITHKTTSQEMRSIIGASVMKSTLVTGTKTAGHKRLGGQDRFDVAINVSKEGWQTANTVVLANWEAFGDALAAGPLAYKNNGPLLLTKANSLTPRTKQEIERLKAKNVIIVGGPISVSENIVKQLKNMGISVKRLSGNSRMEVAENIAKELGKKSKVVIADGFNFPDALSIAPWASRNGYPILLTDNKHNLTKSTQNLINSWKPNETVISGGPLSVSDQVFKNVPNPKRFGGNSRYEVSANIANAYFKNTSTAFVTKGTVFADALTGSVLAAKRNAPILLLQDNAMPAAINNSIVRNGFDQFNILGGPLSVSANIANKLPNVTTRIEGAGYGHGVGMSQYGANERAKAGHKYNQILEFYYPGTKLSNM
ncbi:SpoIID/LytB domain protein [Cytobacillus horneckiae]|uniref:SpoIID/LytB domain-containing protein n=1 Tax=Cytobacillus horneckiae TaxID=549687 RepID=UPI0019D0798C|nr:SpoIID/LytB domain-containing protein [Cytobacillus horneckiae]MBN6885249.1 SpoIID/LytB domain-containing protein [Cytobacillus horneckiae]